jgi:hypothetical protein
MRKPGLAGVAIVSMIAATSLATHAQAVPLRGAPDVRAAMAAVDISEHVFCYGCPGVEYCGCGRPYYSYYYPPRRYYGDYCCERPHHEWGPYLPPEALNWGVHTRWADDYTQY